MKQADLNLLNFQKLNFDGLKTLVDWAKQEGWNPGPYDASVFWETDPDGYYGYYYKDKLIAGGSVVSYDGNFGFMGFFIVDPEFRGKGIGHKLWHQRRDHLLSRLKPGASIGMDGVIDMQSFYNKGGFELAFRDERYMRTGENYVVAKQISSIQNEDFPEILSYDIKCFGVPRPQFLKPWLHMPGSKNFKYIDDGRIKGFALLRKADIGYKVGPLFADTPLVAEALYQACLNAVPGEQVFLDIPVSNPAAVGLVKKYETTYVFECGRMYYGTPPKQDIDKIFGITTFELG